MDFVLVATIAFFVGLHAGISLARWDAKKTSTGDSNG
jgi:hypothetical protein